MGDIGMQDKQNQLARGNQPAAHQAGILVSRSPFPGINTTSQSVLREYQTGLSRTSVMGRGKALLSTQALSTQALSTQALSSTHSLPSTQLS